MTSPRNLYASLPQQAVSLALAALLTAAVLQGLLGLASADHSALLAQRLQATPQTIAQVLVTPKA